MTSAHESASDNRARGGFDHLLSRLRDGEEGAFSEFFIQCADRIQGLIQKVDSLIDDAEAEAIVMQVALKVLEGAPKYKGSSGAGRTTNRDAVAWSWIKRITINHLIDLHRSARRIPPAKINSLDRPIIDKKTGEPGGGLFGDLQPLQDPPVEVQAGYKIGWEEFVSSLSELEYKICESRLEGKTQKEIAKILGYSPARISQILKALWDRAASYGIVDSDMET